MKSKKLRCRIAAIVTLVVTIGTMNFSWTKVQGAEGSEKETSVTAKYEEGQNYVNLEWTDLNYKDPDNDRTKDRIYSYKVYQKKSTEPDSAYDAIPVKTDSIRVLNIYPGYERERTDKYKLTDDYVIPKRPAGDQLKNWVNELALEKAKEGEKADTTLRDILGKDNFKKFFFDKEENNVAYKYARDDHGNFITNGRGIIKADGDKPAKDDNGQYIYIKDPIITVDSVDINYFGSKNIEAAEAAMKAGNAKDAKTAEGQGIVGNDGKTIAQKILTGDYLEDEKVVKDGLVLNPKDDKHKGKYAYDVIYEGGWDGNNGQDLNEYSVEAIKQFIEDGYGFLQGHNTVNYAYNQKLSDYVGYKMAGEKFAYGDRRINVIKRGYLTNFPHEIGDLDETLIIPPSHSCCDFTVGDVWMKYENNTVFAPNEEKTQYKGESGTNNFYLATHKNTASIETGHANGLATPDEEKILMNTLCYLAQVGYENRCEDHSAQDLDAPDAPEIDECNVDFKNGEIDLNLGDTKDNGTLYDYYVTGNNMSAQGQESEVKIGEQKKVEVKTGLDKYLILCDNNANTDIEALTEKNVHVDSKTKEDKFKGITVSEDSNIKTGFARVNAYIHVAAIDKAGNISKTTTKEIVNQYTILGIEEDGESNTAKKNEEVSANITLDHIEEGNKDFKINSIDKLLKEEFTVKYDNSKLEYEGVSKLYDGFRILNVNENEGKITFKVKDKNLLANPIKKNICTLVFNAKEEGQADLSIEDASITALDDEKYNLEQYQCGTCSINIIENSNK